MANYSAPCLSEWSEKYNCIEEKLLFLEKGRFKLNYEVCTSAIFFLFRSVLQSNG